MPGLHVSETAQPISSRIIKGNILKLLHEDLALKMEDYFICQQIKKKETTMNIKKTIKHAIVILLKIGEGVIQCFGF